MTYALKPDLPPLPERMRRLRVDARGWPIPHFVPWVNGEPDFIHGDEKKLADCLRHGRCWICGDILGARRTYVIGPMCAINRVTSEPGSHRDCAIFAATACPFLTRPKMRRADRTTGKAAGIMSPRNPGVALLWTTRTFETRRPPVGGDGLLVLLGPPDNLLWYAEGRPATRAEVLESIEGGYPELIALCNGVDEELADLAERRAEVMKLLPPEMAPEARP